MFHVGPAHLTPDGRSRVRRDLERLGRKAHNYILHARHNIPNAAPTARRIGLPARGHRLSAAWGVRQLMLNAGAWSASVGRADVWRTAVAFPQAVREYGDLRGESILRA